MLWNYAAVFDGPGGPQAAGSSAAGQAKPAERQASSGCPRSVTSMAMAHPT